MERNGKNDRQKVVIVGGVAGGASCAARLRRLDENAEILMVERGPYVSYANCGLPYHVGGVIPREASLLVANEALFRGFFAVDVRTNCEAISVSPQAKTVELRDVTTGEVTTESYDKLVLAPGAPSVRPALPGIDLPGIFHVRTVPDAKTIKEWVEKGTTFLAGMFNYSGIQMVKPVRRAVVVGGGFIGLEMAENLIHLGFETTVIQSSPQILDPVDPEFARLVASHLERNGVRVVLNDRAVGFVQRDGGAIEVQTQSGGAYTGDIVILAIGVRPDTTLARSAGLEIGERGGIRVDDHMRTSDPDIFAVGDAIEVRDFVTGQWSLVALAGPANRQGRIAADVIAGRDSSYRGTQGTAIIGLFGGAAAWTGVSEKTLQRIGDQDYEKIYLYPNSHAGYYPGAKMLGLKVLFRKSDGRLLGAQALGEDGPAVDKRISALAMAIQMKATIYDLEEAELCYAPQFGSAKDAVNFAGMVAADVLHGDMPLAHWSDTDGAFLLDVRQPVELVVESVPGAVNIPLPQLRARLGELPKDREILIICRSAQRAYFATRILMQNGFTARNISGGMLSRAMLATGSQVAGGGQTVNRIAQFCVFICLLSTSTGVTALAQEESAPASSSAADLAKKLANPIGALISVPFQNNLDVGIGDSNGSRNTLNFQPIVPFGLTPRFNLITRYIFPVISQYDLTAAGTHQSGLSDALVSAWVSNAVVTNGWVWGLGGAFLLPTATDDALGSKKFGAGPTAILLRQTGGWTYGALWNQVWSVAGDEDTADVDQMYLQPFLTYNWKSGTGLTVNSEITRSWEAETTVAFVNVMAGGITKFGKQLVQLQVGPRIQVAAPEGGEAAFGVRAAVIFVFPK